MKRLSTDELFHYTKFENLLGIINHGFQPRYSVEHTWLSFKFPNAPSAVEFIPMVSFCDIPLSMVDDHIGKYGKCAIGMNREWGGDFGVNPVIYIQEGSIVGTAISALGNCFRDYNSKEIADIKIVERFSTIMQATMDLSYFVKQYELHQDYKFFINDSDFTIKKCRYYDEREWRFVPQNKIPDHWIINNKTFIDTKLLSEANKKMEKFTLDFTLDDIKYIVHETREQKEEIIQTLMKKYNVNENVIFRIVEFRLVSELD